jgi:hypothetical protein
MHAFTRQGGIKDLVNPGLDVSDDLSAMRARWRFSGAVEMLIGVTLLILVWLSDPRPGIAALGYVLAVLGAASVVWGLLVSVGSIRLRGISISGATLSVPIIGGPFRAAAGRRRTVLLRDVRAWKVVDASREGAGVQMVFLELGGAEVLGIPVTSTVAPVLAEALRSTHSDI